MIRKVLVISDSHGRDANIRKVLRKEGPVDLLLHLGDSQGLSEEIERAANCPVIAVCGNCDLFCRFPMETIVRLGKHKALMVHGHNHFVSLGTDMLKEDARRKGCDIVMFGHTHVPVDDLTDPDVMVFNPGSISLPRQQGREPSYMIIDLDENGNLREEVRFL